MRVIVIAPTRSTCVNLHHLIRLECLPETTLIEQECGDELNAAIAELPQGGFGIVAGTGTGKSAAIRQICHDALGKSALSVGVVTQEHRSNDATRGADVLVVTPGVAVQWVKNGLLDGSDLIVLDEVHQTSEHLELAMALLKRAGCTFVWMSATIDPQVYRKYLDARWVIECSAYDEARRAKVEYLRRGSPEVFLDNNLSRIAREKRGVALFVPARDDAEKLAKRFNGQHSVCVDFYHGGEPAEKLRAFIEGKIPRPYVIVMTSAGASSLNIAGLDTVVIVDRQFKTVVRGGKARLVSGDLDANTLLQMAGRVDGRAVGGEVHIIGTRDLDLRALRPVTPSFKLGGDLELLAMSAARIGIDARDLDLIGSLDHVAYGQVVEHLMSRGVIDKSLRLTHLGEQIERLSVDVAWGEIIVQALEIDDLDLLRTVCLTSCVDELYQLTGNQWSAYRDPLVVRGSDHLTAHNIVAEALRRYGRLSGRDYRLRGADFTQWCKENGYSQKGIQNVALLFSSLLRHVGIALPEPTGFSPIVTGEQLHVYFVELIATVQSMDYVQGQRHDRYGVVFGNNQYGVTDGSSVLGRVRHWTSKMGRACANIEGTEIPLDVVGRYAKRVFVSIEGALEDGRVAAYFQMTFAGQDMGTHRLVVNREELPSEVLREHLNSRQWQNWVDKPEIALPDVADVTAEIPGIVVCAYGADDETGTPLVAYGAVAPYAHHFYSSDPWFTILWTRDEEEAKRRRLEAIVRLEKLQADAKAAVERMRKTEEVKALRQAAESSRQRMVELWRTHGYSHDLSRELRSRINSGQQLPSSEEPEVWRQWLATTEALVVEVGVAIAAAEAQKAEAAARLTRLVVTTRSLRDEVNLLLVKRSRDLSCELEEKLVALDVDDDQLPTSEERLGEWSRRASALIAEARKFLAQPKKPSRGAVSNDALAALAARFNTGAKK